MMPHVLECTGTSWNVPVHLSKMAAKTRFGQTFALHFSFIFLGGAQVVLRPDVTGFSPLKFNLYIFVHFLDTSA